MRRSAGSNSLNSIARQHNTAYTNTATNHTWAKLRYRGLLPPFLQLLLAVSVVFTTIRGQTEHLRWRGCYFLCVTQLLW